MCIRDCEVMQVRGGGGRGRRGGGRGGGGKGERGRERIERKEYTGRERESKWRVKKHDVLVEKGIGVGRKKRKNRK